MEANNNRVTNLIGSLYSEEEELLFVYKNDLILTQPQMIYRIDGGGGDRYYYRAEQSEQGVSFIIYPSTTTFCKKVLPTSPFLLKWMKEQGQEADKVRDLAADYGTLMHICIADFLISGYDFSATREIVAAYLQNLGHHKSLIPVWTKKLNKNLASFKQFCIDWEIEPVLIEAMLASDEIGLAGTIDLVAKMRSPKIRKEYAKTCERYHKAIDKYFKDHSAWRENPGKKAEPVLEEEFLNEPQLPEKIIGSVDFKSGGIHESADLQLQINKIIFHENFPNVKISQSLNWSPKDWETEPTYTIVDQTESRYTYDAINLLLDYYNFMYPEEVANKKVFEFSGVIFNDETPIFQNAKTKTLLESIDENYKSRLN